MVSTSLSSHFACIVVLYLLADFACVQGMSYRTALYRNAATSGAFSPPGDDSDGETTPLEKVLRYFINSQGSDELQRRLAGQLPAQLPSQLAPYMQDPVYGPMIQMYLSKL